MTGRMPSGVGQLMTATSRCSGSHICTTHPRSAGLWIAWRLGRHRSYELPSVS